MQAMQASNSSERQVAGSWCLAAVEHRCALTPFLHVVLGAVPRLSLSIPTAVLVQPAQNMEGGQGFRSAGWAEMSRRYRGTSGHAALDTPGPPVEHACGRTFVPPAGLTWPPVGRRLGQGTCR